MSYSKKPMAQWKDKDVKAWVNSLDGFNDKQKKLICKGVDEIGCDGDSLESAETAEELKDALDIPIILARKLHRKVTAFKSKGDDDSDDDDDSSSEDNKKKKKSKKKSSAKKSSKKKKKEESSDEESSSEDSSSSDDSSDEDGGSDKDDNEEDVLARLIARNLAKKNKINPGSSNNDNSSSNKKKGGFLQWGSSNNNNNNKNNNMSSFGGGGSSDKFIVNIQGSNGKYIQISTKCDKHTTVRQVKQYLAAQEGGDPAKMNLKFNGRNMDDHQNLGFYGIANSRNLITVSYKVVGGN